MPEPVPSDIIEDFRLVRFKMGGAKPRPPGFPVRRITRELERNVPLVVELSEGGKFMRIRPKGCRYWFTVTYRQIWIQGAHNAAVDRKVAKEAAKLERKRSRGRRFA